MLAAIDLQAYYNGADDSQRTRAVDPLLSYRQSGQDYPPEEALYRALAGFGPMHLLINTTMERAVPVAELGHDLFPTALPAKADAAVNALMALGSASRLNPKTSGLLPCRIHNFFRGLPGLWVCMDPQCQAVHESERDGICGTMYSQPRESCECGARVLELYTCRNCGTAYARAYTDDVDVPSALWAEPGEILRVADGETSPLLPLDLLIEEPASDDAAEPADYDLETGRLNPPTLGPRMRTVYLRSDRLSDATDDGEESEEKTDSRGQFTPCAVCGKSARFGRSYVQDHQTKGDQPFQALVARQLQIQPPAPTEPTAFAPLQGRKVLTFSDSRQVAARLAPNIQMYSVRDSLRPLIAWGYRRLHSVSVLRPRLSLEDLYLAVLLASKKLNVRLRPELKSGESFGAELTVLNAIASGETEDDAGLLGLCMDMRNERPPEALLDQIVTTVQDRFLGFEPLALASIAECSKHTAALEGLPSIPEIADTPESKVELARAWLRCWQGHGFWLSAMPPVWWRRPRSQGTSVRGQRGKFRAMDKVLLDRTGPKSLLGPMVARSSRPVHPGFRRRVQTATRQPTLAPFRWRLVAMRELQVRAPPRLNNPPLPRLRQSRRLRTLPGLRSRLSRQEGVLPQAGHGSSGRPTSPASCAHRRRTHRAIKRPSERGCLLQGGGKRVTVPGHRAERVVEQVDRYRRPLKHNDDGGRHRHRCIVRRRLAEHATEPRQLPAAIRTRWPPWQHRRHRCRVRQRGQPRRALLRRTRRHDPR